jgi:endonuclease III
MSTTFKGVLIKREAVIRAMDYFDKCYPSTNQYANWLDNTAFKYAIRYRGRLYPPKNILSEVSSFPTTDFSGGEQTNRVFRQLGFEIGNKHALNTIYKNDQKLPEGKMNEVDILQIRDMLLTFSANMDSQILFPTLEPGASQLLIDDPYAFAIAVCLDRGAKADLIWTIPYYIKNDLGHLDPYKIYQMSGYDLESLFQRLPKKPRFVNAAPMTLQELTILVVEEFEADAAQILEGKTSVEVKRTFQSIYGVGEGIANMAVLLIEAAYPIRFNDLERPTMDIKPDVHTMRVLYRLGVSEVESERDAIEAARSINPSYPGEIDGALWKIGRQWCHASNPNCGLCPMNSVCIKRF